WCTGAEAVVAITAADQAGLSGVAEIRYSVDGGAEQAVAGDHMTVTVPLDAASGAATVRYRAVDRAGNAEPLNQVEVHYDNLAPTLTHVVTPPPNAAGWSTADTTVHFVASDGAGSGLAAGTPDVTVSAETPGVVARGSA